ncbi:MAG TPA: ATP-binding cassette domain-containing protein [Bacteroidetes bacterium]|nr:ATP-binding cassette domain-containing protein [Bacteroidota bacterium]
MKTVIDLKNADIYQGENLILEQVNLNIREAEFSYLIGDTGSGKSSLLQTIYGELPLKKGTGTVAGFNLADLNYKNKHLFRRNLGMIFQQFHLIKSWNVYQNLDYALRALDWKDKKIRDTRIKEVILDIGLQKKLKSKILELSGGEQQRVAIARAILNRPQLLIADEPTGSLDRNSGDELMYLIKRIATESQTAVIFATHDMRIVEKFPALTYKCENGKLIGLD